MENGDITLLHVQKKLKPKIEDVIPEYLYGDMRKTALDFVAHMRANKMQPVWSGSWNRWKATYKGKRICTVRLPRGSSDNEFDQPWMPQGDRNKNFWIITPSFDHINKYENLIIDEGFQDIIWDTKNVYFCNSCHPETCGPRPDKTILGREFKRLCERSFFWFYNPDEAVLNCIKRLLELEQKARAENS